MRKVIINAIAISTIGISTFMGGACAIQAHARIMYGKAGIPVERSIKMDRGMLDLGLQEEFPDLKINIVHFDEHDCILKVDCASRETAEGVCLAVAEEAVFWLDIFGYPAECGTATTVVGRVDGVEIGYAMLDNDWEKPVWRNQMPKKGESYK